MTIFRPCIDLHHGVVKQIVGGSYSSGTPGPIENFASDRPAAWYADLYRSDGLKGGHVIQLGPGNEEAALSALKSFPNGLQVGGGITPENAKKYLEEGASHVIITSWIIPSLTLDWDRLTTLEKKIGRERLVIDLSCRKKGGGWFIAKDQWQTMTQVEITSDLIDKLQDHCAEFLIHSVDVEGKRLGLDRPLLKYLGKRLGIPTTYAGGATRFEDLEAVEQLSRGNIDLTIGSALDIFGGSDVRYLDCVAYNRRQID